MEDHRAGRGTEDGVADQRWLDEGGSFGDDAKQAEEIEMTDVRRTGPPRRLEDRTRFGVPIDGEVDGIWQRAFHVHLAEEVQRQPDLPGAESFENSLTINPAEIKFRFVGSASLLGELPRHDRVGYPAGKSDCCSGAATLRCSNR